MRLIGRERAGDQVQKDTRGDMQPTSLCWVSAAAYKRYPQDELASCLGDRPPCGRFFPQLAIAQAAQIFSARARIETAPQRLR